MGRRRPQKQQLTDRYLSGALEADDEAEAGERFSARSKNAQQEKIIQTALLRAEEQSDVDIDALPVGEVIQVFSLFSEVRQADRTYLCVVRKTLAKLAESAIVVGDHVRIHDLELVDEQGRPQAVIEQALPRKTVLTRADSFKGIEQHPIVANAQQMLIVASLRLPEVRWGLIDRMIVAARSGGLNPIVCLNKIDLATDEEDRQSVEAILEHYASLEIRTLRTSVEKTLGLEELRSLLHDRMTVLAGHSGVGKSSLIRAIQPQLDLRIGAISGYTQKGRHTTTSARRYDLDFGGSVVDTPGVKLFGLWGVTRENLPEFFPDVAAETAPQWRRESFQRILDSLPG
jgi:ribosome biogenesis GTPase